MNRRPMKYNPAFLSGDELVETFVVRQAELGLIVQVLRENKDEITAIEILYSRPYGQPLTYEHVKALADSLQAPPRRWTPEHL